MDDSREKRKRKIVESEYSWKEAGGVHSINGKTARNNKSNELNFVPNLPVNGEYRILEADGKLLDGEKLKKRKMRRKRKETKSEEMECVTQNRSGAEMMCVTKADVSACSENDVNEKTREEFDGVDAESVTVSGIDSQSSKYAPLCSFADSALPTEVLQCCQNFSKPSLVQAYSWPYLLDGRDFIGIAKTGSGKTLAFGIPALMHILRNDSGKMARSASPRCLVLLPTRELAQQIADVFSEAGRFCGVQTVCLYGGAPKGPQIRLLKSGVDVIVSTPGRLKDLVEMDVCSLEKVSFVVLDEADRMLDMGFEAEVRSILGKTCTSRQMVMFSATWPDAVHQLAKAFMGKKPVKVVVGSVDLAANHDVMQIVEVLDDRSRNERLLTLLQKYHKSQRNRVLVFVLYKKEAIRVESMLQNRGWNVVSVHGDKDQHQRNKALALFKEGKCPLMIATDVASRGLDVPRVEVVINYNFPLTTEDYVHRIGRTGRAGKKGVSHTFFTHENKALASELVNVLREAGQAVPTALLKFGTCAKRKESKLYGAHFKEIAADAPKSTKIIFSMSDED